MSQSPLILASQSPGRKFVLEALGYDFLVQPSNTDERVFQFDRFATPSAYVSAIATDKVQTLIDSTVDPDTIIVGGDLVVILDGQPYNKPESMEQARDFMKALMNNWHQEVGAMVVWSEQSGFLSQVDITEVFLPPLTEEELNSYLATANPLAKAGAFSVRAYQSLIQARLQPESVQIRGDITTVIGLSAVTVADFLAQIGKPSPKSAAELEAQLVHDILGE